MTNPLHITSGDSCGASLASAGLEGEVFVWHDLLYDGPRTMGWPDADTLDARASFIADFTGGGLGRESVLETFETQYHRLAEVAPKRRIVLWFDACLFDQSMLVHVLNCLRIAQAREVELLVVDAYPGIDPYHGLGQMTPDQLAGVYDDRRPVTYAQFDYAVRADNAFARRDVDALTRLADDADAPLPWVPAAARRWLEELPNPDTGLGRLETMALDAIRSGCSTPKEIFVAVVAADTPPQYWGDTTLWKVINDLADKTPPLVCIGGPAERLPQWESELPLDEFRVSS